MAQKKILNEMRVKVLKTFSSPLTNRMVEIGEEFNTPRNGFWLRRLKQKDCEEVKAKKSKPASENKKIESNSKKGSK